MSLVYLSSVLVYKANESSLYCVSSTILTKLLTMKLATLSLLLLVASAFAENVDIPWDNLISLEPQLPKLSLVRDSFVRGQNRIVGGEEATPHQFPYQVGVFIHMADGTSFCGGSLISDEWVLTAAHCADPGNSFTVELGAHLIREDEDSKIRLTVTDKRVHPGWDSSQILNDVALLKLPTKVPLSDKIQTVRLPSRSQANELFENVVSTVSGWGRDSDDSNTISPVLRWVQTPVITNSLCNLMFFGAIKESNICTSGSGGKSTCNGDSGGPLVITDSDSKPTQVGVVSFGISLGCEVGWPAAFARVTSFLDWISSTSGIPIRN